MTADLASRVLAAIEAKEAKARAAQLRAPGPWRNESWTDSPLPHAEGIVESNGDGIAAVRGGDLAEFVIDNDPETVRRRCAADRKILDEHRPVLRTVEWPHDQTGKGEAWVCPRCQNAENDSINWRPPVGMAGEFPHDGFVTDYVLAPCVTLLALAEGYGIEEGK